MNVEGLNERQRAALEALLSSRTHEEAAQKAGISRVTLWRMLKDETFRRAYREARERLAVERLERLRQTARRMEITLEGLAYDETAPATARVAAARTLLDEYRREGEALELHELYERLERLERSDLEDEADERFQRFKAAFEDGSGEEGDIEY